MKGNPSHLSPFEGERSSEARVRGSVFRTATEETPHPRPLPFKRGEGAYKKRLPKTSFLQKGLGSLNGGRGNLRSYLSGYVDKGRRIHETIRFKKRRSHPVGRRLGA